MASERFCQHDTDHHCRNDHCIGIYTTTIGNRLTNLWNLPRLLQDPFHLRREKRHSVRPIFLSAQRQEEQRIKYTSSCSSPFQTLCKEQAARVHKLGGCWRLIRQKMLQELKIRFWKFFLGHTLPKYQLEFRTRPSIIIIIPNRCDMKTQWCAHTQWIDRKLNSIQQSLPTMLMYGPNAKTFFGTVDGQSIWLKIPAYKVKPMAQPTAAPSRNIPKPISWSATHPPMIPINKITARTEADKVKQLYSQQI